MNLPSRSRSTSQATGLIWPGLSCKAFTEGKSNSMCRVAHCTTQRQRILGGEALQLEPELCSCENSLFSPETLEPGMLRSHDILNAQTKTEDMFCETL